MKWNLIILKCPLGASSINKNWPLLQMTDHSATTGRSLPSSCKIIKSPFPHIHFPNCTIPDLIWGRLERWPDKTAIECGVFGKRYTYGELKVASQRFALFLLKFGLTKNDTVTLILPNVPEFPIVLFGVFEAGLRATCINPLYTEDEISYQMKDVSSTFVVTVPSKIESSKP